MSGQLPRTNPGGMVATISSSMKRAVGILISCVMVCALLPNSNATNYYVSTSGSDTNPGTQALPWQTINNVNSTTFGPGDEILFQGGQTFTGPLIFTATSAGTAANPIVVSSYGTGLAIISSTSDGIDITDTQGFSISGLVITGVNHNTNTGRGIYLLNDLVGNVKLGPITIDSVTVNNFGYDGISIYGLNGSSGWNSVTITNSTSYANRDGVQSYGLANNANQNIFIDQVTTHDNPGRSGSGNPTGSGIGLGQTNGATIQRCVAYNNGASNTSATGPVGIWCYNSNNVTIQFCESYNNTGGTGKDGDGFDLDINTTNSTLQYNYSHGNAGAGYLFGGAGTVGGNNISFNVSQNDGLKNGYAGIEAWGTVANVVVEGNWVFAQPPAAAGILVLSGAQVTNVQFLDNVIFVGRLPILRAEVTSGLVFSGNDYWRTDGSFLVTWGGTSYTSLTAWKTASGQENGAGFNSSPPWLLTMPAPTPTPTPTPTPPVLLASISPANVYAKTADFTLEVAGDKFTSEMRIFFDERELPTKYKGPQQMSASVTAAMIANPGLRQIKVRTPDAREYSNQIGLTVAPPPTPNYSYVGIFGTPHHVDTALLQDKNNKEILGVQRGDLLSGRFRVTSISEKEVVFVDTNLKINHRLAMTEGEKTAGSPTSRPTPRVDAEDDEPKL